MSRGEYAEEKNTQAINQEVRPAGQSVSFESSVCLLPLASAAERMHSRFPRSGVLTPHSGGTAVDCFGMFSRPESSKELWWQVAPVCFSLLGYPTAHPGKREAQKRFMDGPWRFRCLCPLLDGVECSATSTAQPAQRTSSSHRLVLGLGGRSNCDSCRQYGRHRDPRTALWIAQGFSSRE
ncbi:hypothetical protein CIHG_04093 [Coccidioides immitis H538.4]|uniref:Uncharacterized protein n=3 Tax=Coccidioides immitis TaxID=5501 RepID=A0A0J8QZP9_COCIT|nr:hypothetical protein CIRG_04491 [Coccidioides immitis RMSCC 2394]KMU78374.1 hypothetical protein CISG_07091 [Coccidioides immitis RMSCC 3703]KMU86304.1 hypothetical protein CIHG_04093 [Coccidioides immitis H538.4]